MKYFKTAGAVALTLTFSGQAIALHTTEIEPDVALERIDLAIADIADRADTAWPDLAALTVIRAEVEKMATGKIEVVDITAHLGYDDGNTVLAMDVGGKLTDTVITDDMIIVAKTESVHLGLEYPGDTMRDLIDIDDDKLASVSTSPGAPDLLATITGLAASTASAFDPRVPRAA